jgi:hypothetical protein
MTHPDENIINILEFLIKIASYTLVGWYYCFGSTYCLQRQGTSDWRLRQCVPPKRWYSSTRLCGVITQKTTV